MAENPRAGSFLAEHLPLPAGGGGSIPTSALRFDEIKRARLRRLNAEWHSQLPRLGAINTMRICYGASFEGVLYAVAAWSNPVARELDQVAIMELRRFAIASPNPKNLGSRMLAWMARDVFKRFPAVERLISYSDTSKHAGTIYKAAGWSPVAAPRGGDWCNRKRGNRVAERLPSKIRWEVARG